MKSFTLRLLGTNESTKPAKISTRPGLGGRDP